jgi:polysaccharide biosynthesis transport protein
MEHQSNHGNDALLPQLQSIWKRRKWLAIAVFSTCLSAASGVLVGLPNLYRASVTVMVNRAPLHTGDEGFWDEASADTRLDSITEEVESRPHLQQMIARFHLYSDMLKHAAPDTVIQRMRRDITLERETGKPQWGQDQTFAFTLSYQGWDPKTVAAVTNALADDYVQENRRLEAQQASTAVQSLEQQLQSVSQKLDRQQETINTYKHSHVGELPEQQDTNLATLQRLNTELQLNAQSQMQIIQRRADLLKQGDEPVHAELPELEKQLTMLRTKYTDQYPDIVRLKSRIAALKLAADSGGKTGGDDEFDALTNELTSLKRNEQKLQATIATYQKRVDQVPLLEEQLQSLMQGYTASRDLYTSLLKRYETAKLQQTHGIGNRYRILDAAVPPLEPAGPDRLRMILMAFVVCIGVAVGVMFLVEQMDTSFHTADDLKAFTTLSILVSIPRIISSAERWRRLVQYSAITVSVLLLLTAVAGGGYEIGHGNKLLVWLMAQRGA